MAAIIALALAVSGCGSADIADQAAAGPATTSTATAANTAKSTLPRIELPVGKGETVEGLLDVGGHDIYARCSGTGSPTVVYFTGWAPDASKLGVNVIKAIEAVDAGRHRICSYERRNTGRSETVDGTQAPEDIVADVDGVLDALGENGPFVLLGASFGGLVSGAYAVAHPDRTAGILLLDASTPDDYLIEERHGFDGMCLTRTVKPTPGSLWRRSTTAGSRSGPTTVATRSQTYRSSTWQPRIRPTAETSPTTRSGRRSCDAGRPASGSRSGTALDGRSRPGPRREEPGADHRSREIERLQMS